MQYRVLEPTLSFETSDGTFTTYKGQMVTLQKDIAMKLLGEGKIEPIEKVAYKVYSEILQGYLWIVETDQDMHSLKSQGVTEAIYTNDEIEKLKGISKDSLKEIHKAKKIFERSKIEKITRKERA